MVYDSVANSSIRPASNAKDFPKKKRANRSAKLRQCKLNARREQWLSQVKNKGCEEETNDGGEIHDRPMHAHVETDSAIGILDISVRNGETDGSANNCSDSDSSFNSRSHASSVLGINGSGTNFSGSSRSSRSSSSGGSYTGNVSEEDDDGCLDDWEAVADALAATDDNQEQLNPNSESPPKPENVTRLDSPPELANNPVLGVELLESKPENSRAWRPDDVFRPQSLPNLLKQHSFPMKSDRDRGHAGPAWVNKNVISAPSSCPICCEDLDFTDSSFLPCFCGFRLCLFCHKRILEEDGRCPGCRKQYDLGGGNLTFQLSRSCSMITRS